MIDIIINTLGEYTQGVDPVTGQAVIGVAGLDWPWITGAALLLLGVWAFFKVLSSIFNRR